MLSLTVDQYVGLAGSPDLSSAVWQATAKHYETSYVAWANYTEALMFVLF